MNLRCRPFPWLQEGWLDLRFAVRSLARIPGFISIARLVLAVGIGVNTAVFSVLNARTPQAPDQSRPQSLVKRVTTSSQGIFGNVSMVARHQSNGKVVRM